MAIFSKLHRIVGEKPATNSDETSTDDPTIVQIRADDKEAAHDLADKSTGATIDNEEKPSEDAQIGVRQIEAVTLTWGKGSVFTILILYVLSSTLNTALPLYDSILT